MDALLIVEDDDNLRKLYTEEFVEEGYRVISAGNSHDALRALDQEIPDVAILDLVMPGIDGIELLERFVKQAPQLPVIINTAYPAYQHNYLTWSADAYIVKSSDLAELKRTVAMILSNRRDEAIS